jgi:hypothetical protein
VQWRFIRSGREVRCAVQIVEKSGFGRFVHWLDDPADRELVDIVREGFDQLRAVASGT